MVSIEARRKQKATVMRQWRKTKKGSACTRRYTTSKKGKQTQLRYQRAARLEAIEILGGKCACPCGCQDSRKEILEIAHKNGDGKAHRAELGGASSYALSLWVKRNPTSDRVWPLCPSCHVSWDKTHGCAGIQKTT